MWLQLTDERQANKQLKPISESISQKKSAKQINEIVVSFIPNIKHEKSLRFNLFSNIK